MSMVSEAGAMARMASAEPPAAAASLAARERFDRALAGQERDPAAPERLIMPGPRPALAADADADGVAGELAADPAAVQLEAEAEAEVGPVPGWEALDAAQREADDAALQAEQTEQPEQTDAVAADPALLAVAAGVAVPLPGAGAPGQAGDGIAGGPAPVAAAGAAAGTAASHAAAAPDGAAQDPMAGPAAAAPDAGPGAGQPPFGELVARYRESYGDGAGEIDGAAASGWVSSPGQPAAGLASPPAMTDMPAASAPGAARMAEFLLRQVPLAGSPGDPVSMTFPQGSGPIDQIVFMRDPGGLYMVVSSQPGSRDAVQRGLGELERRLRERGIAVGGIRLADPVGAPDDRGAGAGAGG